MRHLLVGLLFSCVPIANGVAAPSFSCAKAATVVEKAICSDQGLQKLDRDLAKAYRDAKDRHPVGGYIKDVQRRWLMDTRDACADTPSGTLVGCLSESYQRQILRLNEMGVGVVYADSLPFRYEDGNAVAEIRVVGKDYEMFMWGGARIHRDASKSNKRDTYTDCQFRGRIVADSNGEASVLVGEGSTGEVVKFTVRGGSLVPLDSRTGCEGGFAALPKELKRIDKNGISLGYWMDGAGNPISPKCLVTEWESSDNFEEFSKRYQMPVDLLRSDTLALLKQGVDLTEFPPSWSKPFRATLVDKATGKTYEKDVQPQSDHLTIAPALDRCNKFSRSANGPRPPDDERFSDYWTQAGGEISCQAIAIDSPSTRCKAVRRVNALDSEGNETFLGFYALIEYEGVERLAFLGLAPSPSECSNNDLCRDPALLDLQAQVKRTYELAVDNTSDEAALQRVHRSWKKTVQSHLSRASGSRAEVADLIKLYTKQIEFLRSGCIQEVHHLGSNCVCDKTGGKYEICGAVVSGKRKVIDGRSCFKTIDGYRSSVYQCGPDVIVRYGSAGACEFGWDIYKRDKGTFHLFKEIEVTEQGGRCVERSRVHPNTSWTVLKRR